MTERWQSSSGNAIAHAANVCKWRLRRLLTVTRTASVTAVPTSTLQLGAISRAERHCNFVGCLFLQLEAEAEPSS